MYGAYSSESASIPHVVGGTAPATFLVIGPLNRPSVYRLQLAKVESEITAFADLRHITSINHVDPISARNVTIGSSEPCIASVTCSDLGALARSQVHPITAVGLCVDQYTSPAIR